MRKLLVFLLIAPALAQQIAPRQIAPGTNGQTLQTISGVATWSSGSGTGLFLTFTNATSASISGATAPSLPWACSDGQGNTIIPNGPSWVMNGVGSYTYTFGFSSPQTGICAIGAGQGLYFPAVFSASFTSLSAAIAALPSGGTLIVDNNLTVASNQNVPKNISTLILRGSGFTISSGVSLTLNGPFTAGLLT